MFVTDAYEDGGGLISTNYAGDATSVVTESIQLRYTLITSIDHKSVTQSVS